MSFLKSFSNWVCQSHGWEFIPLPHPPRPKKADLSEDILKEGMIIAMGKKCFYPSQKPLSFMQSLMEMDPLPHSFANRLWYALPFPSFYRFLSYVAQSLSTLSLALQANSFSEVHTPFCHVTTFLPCICLLTSVAEPYLKKA